MGNITEITDDAQQDVFFNGSVVSPSQTFQYDALYRLTKASGREHAYESTAIGPDSQDYVGDFAPKTMKEDGQALIRYNREWTYDDVGNILSLIHTANNNNWNRSYTYQDGSNRLFTTEVGGTTMGYSHNAHGSMTAMPHLSAMDWDYAEHLVHVTRGTTEAYYNYDSQGQRVRKVVVKGSITEERLYLGGFEIFRKRIGTDLDLERATLHVMDDKKRVALVELKTWESGAAVVNSVPTLRYQLDNHLGSASLELDESANIISYEEYYPYGDTSYQAGRSSSEVSQKRYRYTGKEKDEESGLYYHGARYYACWLGRWTASDPAGMVDGVNLYMYVRGNPVRLWDPSGNAGIDLEKGPPKINEQALNDYHYLHKSNSGNAAPDLSAVHDIRPDLLVKSAKEQAKQDQQQAELDLLARGSQQFLSSPEYARNHIMGDKDAQDYAREVKFYNDPKLETPVLGDLRKIGHHYQRGEILQGFGDAFLAGLMYGTLLEAGVGGLKSLAASSMERKAVGESITLNSSNELMGVEKASPELLEAISKKRTVQFATSGDDLAYLDMMGAEANVGGENMTHILLRENPSKAAVLEEFLHGTQQSLGIIDRLGTQGAETHVKDFMIRHQQILGLSKEDVEILQILKDMGL